MHLIEIWNSGGKAHWEETIKEYTLRPMYWRLDIEAELLHRQLEIWDKLGCIEIKCCSSQVPFLQENVVFGKQQSAS